MWKECTPYVFFRVFVKSFDSGLTGETGSCSDLHRDRQQIFHLHFKNPKTVNCFDGDGEVIWPDIHVEERCKQEVLSQSIISSADERDNKYNFDDIKERRESVQFKGGREGLKS
ncbi:hypothetical protein HUJ04_003066 [Dendroctonus ponderosae]|nr:hypothetical protein HUJ04_003066 [Dendroctonus ponderosae]